MIRRRVPIDTQHILRQLHERELDLSSLDLIEREVKKLKKAIKPSQSFPVIEMNGNPAKIPPIYAGTDKPPVWHHPQGSFRLDFRHLWSLSPEDCQLSPHTTLGEWIDIVGARNSPNANLLDCLLQREFFHLIPKDFCEEKYEEKGEKKTRAIEVICAGTCYSGQGRRHRKRWVRYVYKDKGIEKLDWGWANLKESVTARNYRVLTFSEALKQTI